VGVSDEALGELSPRAREPVQRARAMSMSYGVRLFAAPGERRRVVVALGEAHLKLRRASELGKEVVAAFDLRGVETFQARRVAAGRALRVLIHGPRLLLRVLSLGAVKGSTITDAKALSSGTTVELERVDRVPLSLHVMSVYLASFFAVAFAYLGVGLVAWLFGAGAPWLDVVGAWLQYATAAFEAHMLLLVPAFVLRRRPWAWWVHPLVALVVVRDGFMADATAEMMRAHPDVTEAVVVMGRAHLPGLERELVERHGFRRIA
jgi:hypothetical protein